MTSVSTEVATLEAKAKPAKESKAPPAAPVAPVAPRGSERELLKQMLRRNEVFKIRFLMRRDGFHHYDLKNLRSDRLWDESRVCHKMGLYWPYFKGMNKRLMKYNETYREEVFHVIFPWAPKDPFLRHSMGNMMSTASEFGVYPSFRQTRIAPIVPRVFSRLPERSGQLQSGGIAGVCFTSRKWTQKLRMREWRERSDWWLLVSRQMMISMDWFYDILWLEQQSGCWTLNRNEPCQQNLCPFQVSEGLSSLHGSEFDPPTKSPHCGHHQHEI